MKRSDAFPSKYVSKDDVEQPVVWTIKNVDKVEMDADDGGKKQPPVCFFIEPESKPLILNNANWMTLEDAYGDESDNWTGKRIELYKDASVMFGGKRVGGVRVRKPQNGTQDRTAQIAALKDLREKIVAAGGEKSKLHDTDIDTDAKLQAQIDTHKLQLEMLLTKNL